MNPFSVSRRHTHVPFSKFVLYRHMNSGFEQPVEHVFRGLHYDIHCVWAKHKDAIDGSIFAVLVLAYLFVPILPYYDASWRLLLALGSTNTNLQYV